MSEAQTSLYFVGIGGIGMSSVAGLAKAARFTVCGSDQNLYPPSSHVLEELAIPVFTPYAEENIERNREALFIIGNSLSRQHTEVAAILAKNCRYTSYPQFLSEYFLRSTTNLVVCGTHGKTTTTSLLAYIFEGLGLRPSYMIGGEPRNLARAFEYGSGNFFILEGDEYDTAFFDKGSKFLHYRPNYIVLNNLEFDHADIFKDLAAVKKTFHKLLDLITHPENVIANLADSGVRELLQERGWGERVFSSAELAPGRGSLLYLLEKPSFDSASKMWQAKFQTKLWGPLVVRTQLPGAYNFANIAQALGCLLLLVEQGKISAPSAESVQSLLENFRGVSRRFEHISSAGEMNVYIDFAHHPTAVKNVLANFRVMHPEHRLIVAFEPKNASSRRNVFESQYVTALSSADQVLLAPSPVDTRIPEHERINTGRLSSAIGDHAIAFASFNSLYEWLTNNLRARDVLVFLSCGDFAGLPRQLVQFLAKRETSRKGIASEMQHKSLLSS